MLVKPDISDDLIIERLRAAYGLASQSLDFLPIGNDARAWSYSVKTADRDYFLKLRKGGINPAALAAPDYLRRLGIDSAVAPHATESGCLHTTLDDFALLLYPFVAGKSEWDMALSGDEWRRWGGIMRAIHNAPIKPTLEQSVPREVFAEKWLDKLQAVETAFAQEAYAGDIAQVVARLWRENAHEIALARSRYLSLGAKLAADPPPFVLCHADIHRANIIIDAAGAIRIVDWDETIIAPAERDLMFFLHDGLSRADTAAFFAGYGDAPINWLALAYYKYDWALQEFADYGERVFLFSDIGAPDLALARRAFERLFAPDDVVERARQAYKCYIEASGSAL